MAGGIKKTEIVEADLGQLSNELKMVGDNILRIIEISSKVKPITGLTELSNATKQTSDNAAELDRIGKKLALSEQRLKDLMDERTKAIIANNKATQEQTAEMKRQATIAKQVEGSYEQINASMNSNIITYKKLSQAQRENESVGGQLIKTIQAQDAQLKQLDATMGRNQRNVGNYKSGFNGLNFSIMQVGRELPSLAYGFNVFVGAISNNLPMVTDEITRAKKELADLALKGEKGVPIWKQLAGAIFSWQTAMVVGITVMTMYGREIGAWLQKVFKGKDAIDSLRKAQENFNEARKEGLGNGAKEASSLDVLYRAATNYTKSQEERNAAVKELQKQYPDYFANMDAEYIKTGNAAGAYQNLRLRIIEAAKARVYSDKIAQNSLEMAKKQEDLDKALAEAQIATNKRIEAENKLREEGTKPIGPDQFEMGASMEARRTKLQETRLSNIADSIANEISILQDANALIEKNINVSDLTFDPKGSGKSSDKVKAAKEEKDILIDIEDDFTKNLKEEQRQQLADAKEAIALVKKAREDLTNIVIGDSLAQADEEKLIAQELTIEKIRAAKNEKDEIEKIQHELTLFMIDEDIKAQQRILDSAGLEADAYANASERIRRLRLQRGEEEIQFAQQTEEQKKAIRSETMQATNELLQQGLSFSQQIYSAQATRAQEAYDAEMNAAGDSLEYQTLAKRKFEAEDKKIKQRQAIASKLQAVLDASLALALAIATTWKNPFLAAVNIGAATLGLGMALATPIPQFAEGTDFAPSSFIAGEEGSELIKTKSGKMILTPNKATLFSDNSLIGSSIIPHDQTQRMLANMAFNQVHDVIDLSKTNSHLESMDKQMKNKVERSIDSKGRTVVRRGSLVSTL